MDAVEQIAVKMDALGLWPQLQPYNWAICPRGTSFPYFCNVVMGGGGNVLQRFLLLEGWQTLHDYLRVSIDHDFGFISSPMELPHFEISFASGRQPVPVRYDTGYAPHPVTDTATRERLAHMLWEAYGVMLRIESDTTLPMHFADENAIFARVEKAPGVWADEPLAIPPPRPHHERISFRKSAIARAKDLPFDAKRVIDLDFRLVPFLMTQEPRPRTVYEFIAIDAGTGKKVLNQRQPMTSDVGLRELWESIPPRTLNMILDMGVVPGEIRVRQGRVFRIMRPLCLDLPFKLSLHDALPNLDIPS